ncbi:MAG: hypothetical protein FD189_848 [Elusimicrobia bacterium]|nr:MAG: hypothetical protein FD154_841 [Elusimicrobiota bacterium]KAF0156875.1 MAG: hypothetical protein FD189_848 [Elusimicrobiota bacterium]
MSTKLALAALTMGVFSFIHFFGVEKAAMAVAFGVLALKDPSITDRGRKLAKAAVLTGLAYLLVLAGVVLYHLPGLNALAARLR